MEILLTIKLQGGFTEYVNVLKRVPFLIICVIFTIFVSKKPTDFSGGSMSIA